MTHRRFVALGLRLFALWLFLFAFQSAAVFMAVKRSLVWSGSDALAFIPATCFFLGGLVVWKFAAPFSALLLPGSSEADAVQLSPSGLVRAGCVLIGLWELTSAFPSAARVIALGFVSSQSTYGGADPNVTVAFMVCAAQMVLAVWLILANRSIVAITLGRDQGDVGG